MINIIALLTMFIDHIGALFFPDMQIFSLIGRISFPLFSWGIARGYRLTRDFKKYAARLFLLALVSQVPYYLLFENGLLNICFTLLAGLFLLRIYDSKSNGFIKLLQVVVILGISFVFRFDYGVYGVLTIWVFHKFWNQDIVVFYQGGLTLFSILLFGYDPIQLFSIFASFIILIFKTSDLRLNRVIQYSFYPAHLFLLFVLS
ncbi:MAG: TraX family protein [Clostridia bacterium]